MQDIVFYAAVNETQGIVRDSANARNQAAPILVLGVSACLKMRLFAACSVATPYPISSLGGISDWNWRMDADFDRDTPSKLVADAGGISVRTVTDTVDGETVNFTEFVIPISDMNTQELTDWLGNEKKRSGLIGELVGYDSEGNAVFVLQIDDFTVRNRVAGLGDPTAIEQEVATRSQTVQMIRAAVSSSAATKQDRLTSANAGANISIDENGVISNTYSLPSATTESRGGVILATAAETKSGSNATKAITPACFLSALSGNDQIIAKSAIQAFQPIIELGSATSATIAPGSAYRLSAVSGNHYLTVSDVPADKYGTDAHVELFVGGTTLVHVLDPLILMDALIPNAVNDCVIKFRDGTARLFVEDHAYGYVVTVAGGTGGTVFGGSLHYGLTGATASYIAFANSLNGQTVILPETASVNRAVNIVGNGYTQTVISGGISCTSKTTFSNLGMNGVSILGGTVTFGDVYIPSGATVSVRGGWLSIEKVSGDGGTIDLGGTRILHQVQSPILASGITFTNGRGASGAAIAIGGNKAGSGSIVSSCIITDNGSTDVTYGGAVLLANGAGPVSFVDCVISGNTVTNTNPRGIVCFNDNTSAVLSNTSIQSNSTIQDMFMGTSAHADVLGGCAINYILMGSACSLTLAGSNSFREIDPIVGGGSITISSGAIVDLTSATYLNPGGGITFAEGGATVYPSAGSASAYMLGGMTVPRIGNTNVVNLNSSNIIVSGGTAIASGCTFSGGSGTYGGAIRFYSSGILSSCTFSGNNATYGRDIALIDGAKVTIVGCSFSAVGGVYLRGNNNTSTTVHASDTELQQVELAGENTSLTLAGNIVEKYRILDTGKVFISSGATVDLTGNSNATPINPGGGITLYGGLSGSLTAIIGSGGVSHTFEECEVHGSTITSLGLIYGATIYPGQYGHDVVYTEDGGTTSSSTLVGADSSFVVPGGLMKVEKYD